MPSTIAADRNFLGVLTSIVLPRARGRRTTCAALESLPPAAAPSTGSQGAAFDLWTPDSRDVNLEMFVAVDVSTNTGR